MTIFETYRERGYKPKELGCFEEWTLWLYENVSSLETLAIETTMQQMRLSASAQFEIYTEHLELCSRELQSRKR